MRKTTIGSVVVGLSAVAAVAAPASATTYVVYTGTNKTPAKIGVTGKTIADGRITSKKIDFVVGSLKLGCASGTAKGFIKRGRHTSGANIGGLTSSSWTSCVGPANLAMGVKQLQGWSLNASGTPGATTALSIGNVKAKVYDKNTGGKQCSAIITGSAKGSFASGSQVLSLNGSKTLKLSNVVGCFGQVHNGSVAQFYAKYKISNATGKPIKIKAR